MRPLDKNRAGLLLDSLTEAVVRHPRWFVYPQLLLVLVCLGYTVARLQFSANENERLPMRGDYRGQFLEFKREFNIQNNFIVLVESENREKNREFVERLGARLRADGKFADVFYRGELRLVGPKALLFLPEEDLAEFQQTLRNSQPLLQTLSQATNLNTLFTFVNRQFRVSPPQSSAGQPMEDRLTRSLQALQWVVDRACDCIESQEPLRALHITTLFSRRQHQTGDEFYFSFAQGRLYLLVAWAKDVRQEAAALEQLRKWVAQTQAEVPGLNVGITGEPVLWHDEMEQARHDTGVAALISLTLTALLCIGSCGRLRRPLMACFCLLVGLGYTLGFAAFTVGRLNLLSITLVPILIGLAIDYGVHLILRYEEELHSGQSRRVASCKAFRFTGLGVSINALIIAGAFYFLALTNFQGMWEMGWLGGTGVILCLIPMFTLLPCLLVRGNPDQSEPPATRGKRSRRSPLVGSLQIARGKPRARRGQQNWRARFEQLYLRRPWWVLAGAGVFTVFASLGCFKLEFDYNLLNLESRGLPAVQAQTKLFRTGSQSLLYCAVIADSLPQAAQWEQRIEQLPSVSRVISLAKYLAEDQDRKLALIRKLKQELGFIPVPRLDPQPVNLASLNHTLFSLSGYVNLADNAVQAQGGNPALEEQLGGVRASLDRLRHLTAGYEPATVARLTAFQQSLFGNLQETISLIKQQDDRQRLQAEDVPAFLRSLFISPSGRFLLRVFPKADVWQRANQEEFIRELRTVDPQVTGLPVQFYEYTALLRQNVERAAAYAAGIIALLVFLHFRSLAPVLLALLPVGFGFCWMLGVMGWLGLSFNPVNIMSLILVIGIGVTNGVHILNRFVEKPDPNVLAGSTGKAVLVSALNTMVGFGSLLVVRLEGIASLGGVMALGTGTCVVASLAFLPAVLTLLGRSGWCPSGRLTSTEGT